MGTTPNGIVYPDGTSKPKNFGIDMRAFAESIDELLLGSTSAFVKGTIPPATDLFTINSPGIYGYWGSSPNSPGGSGVMIVGAVTSGSGSTMVALAIESGGTGRMYTNFRGSVSWGKWQRVDGRVLEPVTSPTGLDANLIDENSTYAVNASAGVLNLPPGAPPTGVLRTTVLIASGSRPKLTEYVTTSPAQHWSRFSGSAGWGAWTRLDAGAIDFASIVAAPLASPNAFKTVPLALTVGGSLAAFPTLSGAVRLPLRFGRKIQRWRPHFRNINPREGIAQAATLTLPNVYFGRRGAEPHIATTWTQLAVGLSGAGDIVGPWQSTPLEADTDYLLAFGWSSPTAPRQVVGAGWTIPQSWYAGSNAATVTAATSLPVDVWIEAEVAPDVPVVAAFGDSLASGVGATRPVYDSWLSQWCRANGALPVHYSASGDTMEGWGSTSHYKWQRWQHLNRPDAVIHAMGSNDVFNGVDLATLKTRRATSMAQLRALVTPTIYSATIMPRNGVTGVQEQVRRDYNTWLKTTPDAARDAFDFVPIVSSDDETLRPEFDADGIHLNAAGYAALAASLTRPIVAGTTV